MFLRILIALFGLVVLSIGGGLFLFVGPPESEIPRVPFAEFEQSPEEYSGWLELTDYRLAEASFVIPNPVLEGEEFAQRAIPLRPIDAAGADTESRVILMMPGIEESSLRTLYGRGPLRLNLQASFGLEYQEPTAVQLRDLRQAHPEYDWAGIYWVTPNPLGPIDSMIAIAVSAVGVFLVLAAIFLLRKKKPRRNDYDDEWSSAPPPLR